MIDSLVTQIVNKLGVTGLLDYHCGDASLFRSLKADHEMKLQCYDPEIPAFSGAPLPMQMVTCIDVLDESKSDEMLDDLKRVTEVIGFFTINEKLDFWLPKIISRFDLQTLQAYPGGYYLIVYAKPQPLIQ